jgi:hypothetical protein
MNSHNTHARIRALFYLRMPIHICFMYTHPSPHHKVSRCSCRPILWNVRVPASGCRSSCCRRRAQLRCVVCVVYSDAGVCSAEQSVRRCRPHLFISPFFCHQFISPTHCCVCSYTVQYFVWFFSFLPLALSRLPLHHNPRPRSLVPSLLVAGKPPPTGRCSRGPHLAPAQLSLGQQRRGRG